MAKNRLETISMKIIDIINDECMHIYIYIMYIYIYSNYIWKCISFCTHVYYESIHRIVCLIVIVCFLNLFLKTFLTIKFMYIIHECRLLTDVTS